MLKKLSRLISVLLILALSLYIVLLNRESVSINLGNEQTISAPLGAVIIVIFALGVFCTALVASFFGFKAYLREKSLLREERKRLEYDNNSAKARGLTLSSQYQEAIRAWEHLSRQNPSDIQARLWLAKTLQADNQLKEALKVVDAARVSHPGDIETLFLASELNQQLGNYTSSIDNLALITSQRPNIAAAIKARDLSWQLGRYDDALEYNRKLDELGYEGQSLSEFEAKVKLEKIQKNYEKAAVKDEKEYLEQLAKLSREYPECSSAFLAAAEVQQKNGDFDKASQAYIKAAYIQKTTAAWFKPINLWIEKKEPERALSVARLALKDSGENNRADFELLLAKTQILLGMYSESAEILRKIKDKGIEKEQIMQLTRLLGLSLARDGKDKEAAELWLDTAAA